MKSVILLSVLTWIIYNFAAYNVEYKVYNSGIVVISGASSGIGLDSAIAFAEKGFHVFLGVRKQNDFDGILQMGNAKFHPVILDVMVEKDVESLKNSVIQFQEQSKLPLVALINNAGISYQLPIEASDLSKYIDLFEVNLFGVIRMSSALLPLLRQSKGRVVHISSVAGFLARAGCGAYCASKWALEATSDAMRRELLIHGVSVSIIEPGAVVTDIWDKNTGENSAYKSISTEMRFVYSHLTSDYAKEKLRMTMQLAEPASGSTRAAILDSVLNPTPKTRYQTANGIGIPSSILKVISWLVPDRLQDIWCSK